MKKQYNKPVITVEEFTLTENIAACQTAVTVYASTCSEGAPYDVTNCSDFIVATYPTGELNETQCYCYNTIDTSGLYLYS